MPKQLPDRQNDPTGRPGAVVCAALLFAAIHSLFASNVVKVAVTRAIGARYRFGVYRSLYVVQTILMVLAGIRWFVTLPDRVIYEVRPPWSWLMRMGQIGSIGLLYSSIRAARLFDMTGVHQLESLLKGEWPEPETEAQGPALDADGELLITGPFRMTRHPGDLSSFLLFPLFPRMTVNHATLALLAMAYSVVGAFHEEARLKIAYGQAYERYQQRVPFLFPRLNALRTLPQVLLDHEAARLAGPVIVTPNSLDRHKR